MIVSSSDTSQSFESADACLEEYLQNAWVQPPSAATQPSNHVPFLPQLTLEPNSTPEDCKFFTPSFEPHAHIPYFYDMPQLMPCGFPQYFPSLHSQQPSSVSSPLASFSQQQHFLWPMTPVSDSSLRQDLSTTIESDKSPHRTPQKMPSSTSGGVLGETISWRSSQYNSPLQPQHLSIKHSVKRVNITRKPERKCFIMDSFVYINEKKYELADLENAYAMDDYKVIIRFRIGMTIKHTFEKPHAENFVSKLIERALALRLKKLDKEIETILRRSITDCEVVPGSYVKISESLLGNSTEQTARVLWIHNDMITVQLPSGSAKLPIWYVTAMDDPYKIIWLRTFAEKLFSKRTQWASREDGEIPEAKILREGICKTVDWIVSDYFDKWSDQYFIQGHELNRTEVTTLVDQKLFRVYLKSPLAELRNDHVDPCLQQSLEKLESIAASLWTTDLQELSQYKRGIRHMINQERKSLYSRIVCLTRMVEEYGANCPGRDDSEILKYLLFSYMRASALLCPKMPGHNSSNFYRCLLTRLDLQLMLDLSHPEFMNARHARSIELFFTMFDVIDSLLSTEI